MGVVSVRLTSKEEKILAFLADHFEEDKSTLIKHSILDLYEDLKDIEVIDAFEKRENKGKTNFTASKDVLKLIE
ncbi:MAG: hypothetical protein JXB17_10795 [Bacteroidales bacterium]|nr:hypothetical protein [Bacteroidales bacterium]